MKKDKSLENSVKEIQSLITEGKEVLIKNEERKTECYIEQNINAKEDFKQWCLLLNGNEFFCKEIIFNLPVRTCTINYKQSGSSVVVKRTINCMANEVKFENNIAVIS